MFLMLCENAGFSLPGLGATLKWRHTFTAIPWHWDAMLLKKAALDTVLTWM